MKNKRFIVIYVFLAFVLAACVARLFSLQVIGGDDIYKAPGSSEDNATETHVIASRRGSILASGGEVLAGNRIGYNLYMAVRKGVSSEDLDNTLGFVLQTLSENGDEFSYSFSKYITYPDLEYGYAMKSRANKLAFFRNFTGLALKELEEGCSAAEMYEAILEEFGIDRESYEPDIAYVISALRFELLWATQGSSILIAEDISPVTNAILNENSYNLKGIFTEPVAMRTYEYGEVVSHVVGYIGAISDSEYQDMISEGKEYSADDVIGKLGIEKTYESWLKPYNGQNTITLNPDGVEIESEETVKARSGNDIYLTLDLKLQQVTYDSLEKNIRKIASEADGVTNNGDANAGAAVAIDVKTGKVLALVSYPSYDSSLFLAPASDVEAQKEIAALYKDDSISPTLNRVTQGLYPPGSTFKPMVAIAALESGRFTPDMMIDCDGTWDVDGHIFQCMEYKKYGYTHGLIDIVTGLATSCNLFFHKLGIEYAGIDNIDKWAQTFGLGEKTGIDISGELQGVRNNQEVKKRVTGGEGWTDADTGQASIGQLYNTFSPIQLCRYTAAIANGGTMLTPYLVDRIENSEGETVFKGSTTSVETGVQQLTIDTVKEGMIAVANATDGTATETFGDFTINGQKVTVACKTGTPETGLEQFGQSSHAVFICYAPAEDPEIAIAIVIEHGVWGSNAAPIAKDMLEHYFTHR